MKLYHDCKKTNTQQLITYHNSSEIPSVYLVHYLQVIDILKENILYIYLNFFNYLGSINTIMILMKL